ncbi:hypothetical protein HK099_000166 [Clydaea vesicula]|uniref:RRM domain-containing protein n=1 Tax=Clydaea vesicula TaxID=447962 RepID=A0AAD5TVQ6_9FUNG|nr:hypothetical protein HK099_000166 [Clydaea vesicula]
MSRIYIGRLSRDAQVEDVEKLCAKFGEIKEVNLKNGFGFVEYYSNRNAEDATDELNSTEFFGEKIIVELAKGLARRRDDRRSDRRDDYRRSERESRSSRRAYQHGGYRLIVDNLHSSISWQDLKDYMRKAGHVTFADAHKTRVGEGVVEFSNKDDMRYALETLDGTELKGHKIYLTEKSPRHHSRSPRSRSRSPRRKSRSWSRSKSRSPRRRRYSRSRSRSPRRRSYSPHRRSPSPHQLPRRSAEGRSYSKSPVKDNVGDNEKKFESDKNI